MLKNEFEALMGRKVEDMEYCEANSVYENVNGDKDDFVGKWKTKNGLMMLAVELSAKVNQMRDEIGKQRNNTYKVCSQILDLNQPETDKIALKAMGEQEYLKYKLREGLALTDDDRVRMYNIIDMIR